MLSVACQDKLFVDCSTIDPDVARDMANEARSRGADFIDAPVSGGVPAAVKADLTFMVGGQAESIRRASQLLRCMGQRVLRVGDIGCGQVRSVTYIRHAVARSNQTIFLSC